MNKQKSIGMTALIYVIIFGVYNLLILTIFKTRTSNFWISYGFMILAFAVQIVSLYLSVKSIDVETMFFGIPLLSFSFYFLLAELFISVVFMIFQQMASTTLTIVVQVLFLAVYLVIAILSVMARDTVQGISNNVKQKVFTLKLMEVDVDMLRQNCKDGELKSALGKLSETIHYSDPMTSEMVEEVEENIYQKLNELRVCCENEDFAEAKGACSQMERLFLERNRKLKISK